MMSTCPAGLMRSWTLGLRKSSPVDPLLDDAALLVERREVLLDVDLLVLELDRFAHAGRARRVEIDQRVSEPAHALVELQDRRPRRRAPGPQLADGVREIVRSRDVESDRVTDVLVREDPPAPVFDPSQPRAGSQP